MGRRGFYHPVMGKLALAVALALPPAASFANEAPNPPPRTIKDITRMLDHFKPDVAEVARIQALADATVPAGASRVDLFDFYNKRAEAAAQLGRVTQYVDDLVQAVAHGQENTGAYARSMRNLSIAEMQAGNMRDALEYNRRATKHIPQSAMGQLIPASMLAVQQYAWLGDFPDAERSLRDLESTLVLLRSKPIFDTWGNTWVSAYERARGELFRAQGKHLEAEAAFRKSLSENEAFLKKLPGYLAQRLEAPSMDNMLRYGEYLERAIAAALLRQGRLVEAEIWSRRGLQHALERAGNASMDVGHGLRNLAGVIAEQGRYAESTELIEAAIKVFERAGVAKHSVSLFETRRVHGAGLVALGRFEEASKAYETMYSDITVDPQLSEKWGKEDLDWSLALLRTGKAAESTQMSARLLAKLAPRFGENSRLVAEIRGFHAMALAGEGKREAALAEFRKSVPILAEQARNDAMAETGSQRRRQRLVLIIEDYVRLLADLMAQGHKTQGFDAFRESFIYADLARGSSVQQALTQSAARASISDPALAELARKEQDTQRRINALNDLLTQLLSARPDQQLPAIQTKMKADVDSFSRERDALRAEIQRRFPEYAELVSPRPADPERLRKALKPGEVIVSWYFGEQEGAVWAIAADGKQHMARVALSRAAMAREVEKLRKALNPDAPTIEQIPAFDVQTAYKLYSTLLAPVADVWGPASHLLLVPHGELGQLPLGLLLTEPKTAPAATQLPLAGYKGYPWLIRKVALSQLPSATSLSSLRSQPAAPAGRLPFIGFGDPLFSEEQAAQAAKLAAGPQVAMRGVPLKLRNAPKTSSVDSAELALLPRLPDTGEEIREIGKTLGADPERDLYLQKAANENTVFSTKLDNRRVVMFATHGLVPGELNGLDQPALALTAPKVAGAEGDGLLTQEEILSLKLNADWVVLSACNTAAGEGAGSEAVSGLGRAFFYAGARALLVSNWPVETRSARELMTGLFRRQGQPGGPAKAEALRQSMLELADGPGQLDLKTGKPVFSYAHPLFWAPFVLVGD